MDVYLDAEDEYGTDFRVDKKHCDDDEVRIMVGGMELYAAPKLRWQLVHVLLNSLEAE